MGTLQRGSPPALAAFRSEVTDLRKFVALNYIAVIKACKKRNRHLLAASGSHSFIPLRAVDLLSQQYFFTSGKLASLATQAELMSQVSCPSYPVLVAFPFPPRRPTLSHMYTNSAYLVCPSLGRGVAKVHMWHQQLLYLMTLGLASLFQPCYLIMSGKFSISLSLLRWSFTRAAIHHMLGHVSIADLWGVGVGVSAAEHSWPCRRRPAGRIWLPHLPGSAASTCRAHLRTSLLLGLPGCPLRNCPARYKPDLPSSHQLHCDAAHLVHFFFPRMARWTS
jgi:hypothetical protein